MAISGPKQRLRQLCYFPEWRCYSSQDQVQPVRQSLSGQAQQQQRVTWKPESATAASASRFPHPRPGCFSTSPQPQPASVPTTAAATTTTTTAASAPLQAHAVQHSAKAAPGTRVRQSAQRCAPDEGRARPVVHAQLLEPFVRVGLFWTLPGKFRVRLHVQRLERGSVRILLLAPSDVITSRYSNCLFNWPLGFSNLVKVWCLNRAVNRIHHKYHLSSWGTVVMVFLCFSGQFRNRSPRH